MNSGVEKVFRKVANWQITQRLFSWVLIHNARLIPLKPLRESWHWIVYTHPSPGYPVHLVILPKKAIKNWMALSIEDEMMFGDFIHITQSMIRDFELEPAGYRLILNGGPYQTFPHLHFHLIAGDALPQNNED